jgi:toxin HigB-1
LVQRPGGVLKRDNYLFDTCQLKHLHLGMIGGFRHKGLEELHLTGKTRRIGAEHIRKCVRILQLLEVAERPEDMNIAGFRFHGLKVHPKRWSVRVTGNGRITFGWSGENALHVDFEDYH